MLTHSIVTLSVRLLTHIYSLGIISLIPIKLLLAPNVLFFHTSLLVDISAVTSFLAKSSFTHTFTFSLNYVQ